MLANPLPPKFQQMKTKMRKASPLNHGALVKTVTDVIFGCFKSVLLFQLWSVSSGEVVVALKPCRSLFAAIE